MITFVCLCANSAIDFLKGVGKDHGKICRHEAGTFRQNGLTAGPGWWTIRAGVLKMHGLTPPTSPSYTQELTGA